MKQKIKLNKNDIKTAILYALCGAALAMPMIFNQLWILGWIAYAPIIYFELQRDDDIKPYKRAWLRGLSFFYGYGLTAFCWLWGMYPLDFAGFDQVSALGVVLLGWLGIPLVQGVVSAFNFVVLRFAKRKNMPLAILPIAIAFSWIFFEWVQTLTWAGIPWGKLAVGQTGMLYNIQSASLFGSYFVSLLMILVSGLIALAIYCFKNNKSVTRGSIAIVCAVIIFSSNLTYGILAINTDKEYKNTITVAAIQGNVQTAEKWGEETLGLLELHRNLVIEAGNNGADLVILAETAFPYTVNVDEFLLPYTEEIAKDAGTDMILGCLHAGSENKLYNSTRFVSEENGFSETVYHKRRLVPFGEFVPMGNVIRTILPILNQINLLAYEMTPGNTTEIFETEHGKIGSIICFDSIYESLVLDSVRDGAELLAISTNDSWFQDSAAVYQHNAHAVLRAVETGRYIVRSANTGISSIITDRGEIVEWLEPLVEGYVIGEVKTTNHNTLYLNVGNLIIVIAFIWLLASWVWLAIRSKKSHNVLESTQQVVNDRANANTKTKKDVV